MKYLKQIFLTIFLIFSSLKPLSAEVPHFLDFKFILNESDAGKRPNLLKNRLDKGLKDLQSKEKKLQEDEKNYPAKKLITPEEYKKKVQALRNSVSSLQKERNSLLQGVAKQRSKARNELLKNLNPIVKDYMKEKN